MSSAPAASTGASEVTSGRISAAFSQVTTTMASSPSVALMRPARSGRLAGEPVQRVAGIAEHDPVRTRHLVREHVQVVDRRDAMHDGRELRLGARNLLALSDGRGVDAVPLRVAQVLDRVAEELQLGGVGIELLLRRAECLIDQRHLGAEAVVRRGGELADPIPEVLALVPVAERVVESVEHVGAIAGVRLEETPAI